MNKKDKQEGAPNKYYKRVVQMGAPKNLGGKGAPKKPKNTRGKKVLQTGGPIGCSKKPTKKT